MPLREKYGKKGITGCSMARLFNGNECSIMQVVDKDKSLTFMWLKVKFPSLPFNYHGWRLSPFTMLGVA